MVILFQANDPGELVVAQDQLIFRSSYLRHSYLAHFIFESILFFWNEVKSLPFIFESILSQAKRQVDFEPSLQLFLPSPKYNRTQKVHSDPIC
jgi:hypothetical protein